ncbi:MAG TPA: hypothetical protein VFE45_02505 [Coriobacteriia bacterium]|nr:hypothetical protein [Coriobacteriia bacterium]
MRTGQRVILAAVLGFAVLALAGCAAAGSTVGSPNSPTSGELVEEPKRYDGTTVAFQGEAIGEAMVRGEMAWIHVNDDAYVLKNIEEGAKLGGYNSGMPVWLDATEAREITYFGDFRHKGDIVRVEGVFNAACVEHGGDVDIHATSLSVVSAGRAAADSVEPGKPLWAALLSLAAGALYVANRRWASARAPMR